MQHKIYDREDSQRTISGRLIEYCLIFLLIFTPFAYGAVEPWSVAVFEVVSVLMLLLWVFKMIANGRFEIDRNPVISFAILFIVYVSMQLIFSFIPHPSSLILLPGSVYPWATRTELLKIISYAVIFLVAVHTIKTRQQINRILSIIIAVGFLMAIFFLMRYFGAEAPRGIINPDHYAGYLGMIIPLAFGFLLIRHQGYVPLDMAYARQFLFFFCAIVMSAALFFTMSRGGMFSFIASLSCMSVLLFTRKSIKRKRWILSIAVVFVVSAVAWIGATPVLERIMSIKVEITSLYFGGRLPVWNGTLEIVKDYPVFGTGLGTFSYIFPKYQMERLPHIFMYAHNDFLELLSEIGVAGFSLFVISGLWFAAGLLSRFYKRNDLYITGLCIGILGSLTSILVHSFADFNLHIPATAILTVIILSLLLSLLNYKHYVQRRTYEFGHKRLIHYAPILLLAVIFVAAVIRPALADYYALNTKNEIRNMEMAVRLDPANALYHYQLGKLYLKRHTVGDTEYALGKFRKAVELNPTNSKYHQSLAWTYGQLAGLLRASVNRYTDSAHMHFQKAISLDPNNPYRYRAYAIWLFNRLTEADIKKGVSEYRRAVALEARLSDEALEAYYRITGDYDSLSDIVPDTAEGRFALRNYFNKKGLSERTIKEDKIVLAKISEKINSDKHDVKTYLLAARIYYKLRKNDDAVKAFHKAIELGSRDSATYYWLGKSYEKIKKQGLAVKHFKIALNLDKENIWPYVGLAEIYQNQDRETEAKEMWRAILNLENPNPEVNQIAKRALGEK